MVRWSSLCELCFHTIIFAQESEHLPELGGSTSKEPHGVSQRKRTPNKFVCCQAQFSLFVLFKTCSSNLAAPVWLPGPNAGPTLQVRRQVFLSAGDLTLMVLGPLTNVAVALHLDPSFGQNIKELVIMGGNTTGTTTCPRLYGDRLRMRDNNKIVPLSTSLCTHLEIDSVSFTCAGWPSEAEWLSLPT